MNTKPGRLRLLERVFWILIVLGFLGGGVGLALLQANRDSELRAALDRVRMGASRDAVVKLLGDPASIVRSDDWSEGIPHPYGVALPASSAASAETWVYRISGADWIAVVGFDGHGRSVTRIAFREPALEPVSYSGNMRAGGTIESRVRRLPAHASPVDATRMIGRPMFHCSSPADYRSFAQRFGAGYRVPGKMPGREALVYKVSEMVQLTIVFFDDRSRLSEAHLITRGGPGVRLR